MSENRITLEAVAEQGSFGQRVDQVAASLFPQYSRSQLQQWIKKGELTVNGSACKPKDKVFGGEQFNLDTELKPQGDWQSQDIALDIVFEDEHILVINKPAGMVVHPGAGNPDGTLLNALLHHNAGQELIPRAGIVHRLDKDTSGLMVVAKTLEAQISLVEQLQERFVSREYEAVVQGVPVGGKTIEEPIGRHPRARTKMAVVSHGGKEAITHFRVLKKFSHHTHIRVKLETGRTHQIRVHMAHIGYPLVGDPLYSGRPKLPPGASAELIDMLRNFGRQALHAASLTLEHPESGELVSWHSPLPEDFRNLLKVLDKDK